MKSTFEDGRAAQFQEMMQQLTQLQGRYKGVRGELLAKVAEEFARLKPGGAAAPTVQPPPPVTASKTPERKVTSELTRMRPGAPVQPVTPPIPALKVASGAAEKMLPSCRMCGRGMRRNDADGTLVCEKGHTRSPARVAAPEGQSATQ